jgi:hypothetical protein
MNILMESIQTLPRTNRVCRLCFAIISEAGSFITMMRKETSDDVVHTLALLRQLHDERRKILKLNAIPQHI